MFLQRSSLLAATDPLCFPLSVFSLFTGITSPSKVPMDSSSCLTSTTGAALMGEKEEGFELGNPLCIHLPWDLQDHLLIQTLWLAAIKQKSDVVFNRFCWIRQKWISLPTPQSPTNLMWFFQSFQRPGCYTSDQADVTHAPPDNNPLGNTVSIQGLCPLRL